MAIAFKVLIGLLAALFLYMAFGMIFTPVAASGSLGIEALDLTGMSTLRGDVGGMFLACGVMLVLGLVRNNTLWFLPVALLMATIALGRLVGFAAEGVSSTAMTNFVAELVIIAVLMLAHRRLRA